MPEVDGLREFHLANLARTFLRSRYTKGIRSAFAPRTQRYARNFRGRRSVLCDLGFLIGGILLDLPVLAALLKTFYLRRALRIWPLYLFYRPGASRAMYMDGFPASITLRSLLGLPPVRAKLLDEYRVLGSLRLRSAFGAIGGEQFYLLAPLLVRQLRVSINTLVLLTICSAVAMRLCCFSAID